MSNREKTLTFNIITTNKKSTAIAPTYIIIKVKAKKSTLNKNKIAEELQKVNIRNKTECTGLSETKTNKPLNTKKNVRNKCNVCIKTEIKNFGMM